ncbi:MAG: DUF948 domain-containing protein [Ignavibacteria bacterium]|nr:DUF948 domain-containing protein [Ignavibacteria bacterium]
MEFDLILKISSVFVLVALAVLIIFLIFYLSSLNKLVNSAVEEILIFSKSIESTLKKITLDIEELKGKAETTLGSFNDTSVQIKKSFQNIDEKLNEINGIFKPFSELSRYVYDRVAIPLQTSARLISGASKAINIFFDILSKGKGR